jgi:hypothetical protein
MTATAPEKTTMPTRRRELPGGNRAPERGVLSVQVSMTIDTALRIDARIAEAAERLGLDRLGTAVMSLAAAPEVDPRFGRLFAYLNDDPNRRLATPRLLGALLSGEGAASAPPPGAS